MAEGVSGNIQNLPAMLAQVDDISLADFDVYAGNPCPVFGRTDDAAAGRSLESEIATHMITVMMGVEDMGQSPALLRQGVEHWLRDRRVHGGRFAGLGRMQQKDVIVLKDRDLHGLSLASWRIALDGEPLFALAGLWEWWKDPAGAAIETYTIVTTAANAQLAPIHDRMPVVLPADRHAAWLDVARPADDLLAPLADGRLRLSSGG